MLSSMNLLYIVQIKGNSPNYGSGRQGRILTKFLLLTFMKSEKKVSLDFSG